MNNDKWSDVKKYGIWLSGPVGILPKFDNPPPMASRPIQASAQPTRKASPPPAPYRPPVQAPAAVLSASAIYQARRAAALAADAPVQAPAEPAWKASAPRATMPTAADIYSRRNLASGAAA